ncbi:CCHC-type zinc finger nucleic acid binding protein-like [Gordionus sp. m RMFG-2023]|uniref:CCHC-type zinc finger nucleic acid binding protein-like n=1 Tax=Gordionus sp. m RMFG-2023 TaxID=3053472 RepID=UPI0031FDB113
MVRDCQETKCFGCGKHGHVAPFCPHKQERLRCAGCGIFGHNKENCNVDKYNTRGGFPQRGMDQQNTPIVRTIENKGSQEIILSKHNEEGRALNVMCFKCQREGHVARDCLNC